MKIFFFKKVKTEIIFKQTKLQKVMLILINNIYLISKIFTIEISKRLLIILLKKPKKFSKKMIHKNRKIQWDGDWRHLKLRIGIRILAAH